MAALAHDIPGPEAHHHDTLDLDAGTALPSWLVVTGIIVVIASIILLLHTTPGSTSSQRAATKTSTSLTIPALRPGWPVAMQQSGPYDGIGPIAMDNGTFHDAA